MKTVEEQLDEQISPEPVRCETTLTNRYEVEDCTCDTYPGNLGPCDTYLKGASGDCVYCDHNEECHEKVPQSPL